MLFKQYKIGFFIILIITLIFSCGGEPDLSYQKSYLNSNKNDLETYAEVSFKHKIPYIASFGGGGFKMGNDSFTLLNYSLSNSAIENRNVEIKKHSKYKNLNELLSQYNINRDIFLHTINFMLEKNIQEIDVSKCSIWMSLETGYLGSRSGLVYFPNGCESEIEKYYPKSERLKYPLYKLENSWFVFQE